MVKVKDKATDAKTKQNAAIVSRVLYARLIPYFLSCLDNMHTSSLTSTFLANIRKES